MTIVHETAVVVVLLTVRGWSVHYLQHKAVRAAQAAAGESLTATLGRAPSARRETIGVAAGCIVGDVEPGRFEPTPWPEATVVRVTVRLVEESR